MGKRKAEPGRLEFSLKAWLTLQCQMIGDVEAALAVVGPSDRLPGVVFVHLPSREYVSARLGAAVDFARESGKPVVQEGGNRAVPALCDIAVPLIQQKRVTAVVGVSARGVTRDNVKAIADRLAMVVGLLELWVEALAERERLLGHVALAGTLLDHEQLAEAGHALAAQLALALGCERVALGSRRRGRLQVSALSGSLRFAAESDAVRELQACMEEAADQDAVLEVPPPASAPPHVVRAHEQLLRSCAAGAVRTIPLASRGRSVGALTCEWSPAKLPIHLAQRAAMADAALIAGPVLELMARAEADALERLRAAWLRLRARHFGGERSLARSAIAGAAALLAILAVAPAPYRIAARATLEGRVQRALVAAVDGYIQEANVRAGDLVQEGDILARLDDRDLRLESRKWKGQMARLEKEQREALAGENRAKVSILGAQIDQAAAELRLAEEQIGRTNIVAPFEGVVIEGDLSRSLGSPVDRGTTLFELAPLDGYRIILQIDERDIADVAVGQHGRMALSALPGQRLPLVVERITPMATADKGRNFFRIEAVLEEPSRELRPGMEGLAKIDAGNRRILWIWLHPLLDWLRLQLWSFMAF